ncbi:uncharacterized protein LOC124351132 [Daphnia pulicaria]|uniref:uncharacterized protein LOC124351132 n=1 Tax=Daphnia pulicaria TaxID=35523 RepID=UPI001EEB07BC|nr:uncharacterized protein LOC124351132 [Daphnia pulicaria]
MILIRWLFILAVNPSTMAQQLVEVILDISENSTCPGIVLALPGQEWTEREESVLDELLKNRLNRPVTLLPHRENCCPELREIVCSDAVVVLLRNRTAELPSIYRQLRNCFHLNKLIVAISNSTRQSGDKFLQELRNERIFLLIESSNLTQILKWSVSRDGVVIQQHPKIDQSYSVDSFKLSGRHLKVATLHHPPAVVIRPSNISSEVTLSVDGIEPSVMKLIADALNFTFDYVVAPANEMWGEILTDQQPKASENQTVRFTGIRGMLVRREVDLAFGDLYVIRNWLPHISYSQIYKMDYDCFVVPGPKPLASWMAVVLPFSVKTWLATLASLALVTVGLAAIFFQPNRSASLGSSFLFALGQLLWIQQPRFPDGKASSASLFLIWSWLFAATILSTVYRSGLISFLTHPFAQQPVNTIQQLVESPLNKMMFSDFYRTVLLNSTDPFRRQLGHQLRTTDNMSQMLDLLQTGHWAVDSSLDSLNYLMNNQQTTLGLHVMQERLFPTRSSFGLQRDSPLKPRVDSVLQRLIEAGLVDYHRSYSNQPSAGRRSVLMDGKNNKTALASFSLTNLQGPFYLLGIGIFVSTLAFASEFFVSLLFTGRKK